MSMIFFACVAASAAAVGWVAGRKARDRHEASLAGRTGAVQPPPNPFAAFPCGLQDVIARTKDDELLISGGLRLSEGGSPVAAIFFGVGAPGVPRVLVAFPDRSDVLWLTQEKQVPVGSEPPTTLPWGEALLERSRRLPVLVERFGTELPEVDREMLFAEYRGGAGQGAVVLRGGKQTVVAAGEVVTFASLERYPGS
ncbi:MAG: hypothetical protein RMJ98_15745 [Myxococcales bacterium]|nr:hypothetical protein [Polyangiaceae bacterium]MDW8250749.1 hypothetical protein [Myxococcales bacterium]